MLSKEKRFHLTCESKNERYSLFKDSEGTIHSAGINATSYEPPWFLHTEKPKKNIFFIYPITKNQKTKQKACSGLRQFLIFFYENFTDWSLG